MWLHAVSLLGQKCGSYFQGHHLEARKMGVICMVHRSLMEPPLAAFAHAPGVRPARRKEGFVRDALIEQDVPLGMRIDQ